MNYVGYAVVGGIVFGLFLTAILYMVVHTDSRMKSKYDEMQNSVRGRSYTYAYYTLAASNLIMMALFAMNIDLPIDPYLAFFIALLPSRFVFGFVNVWNNADVGLNSKRKTMLTMYIVIGVICLGAAALNAAMGLMYKDGKLGIAFGTLLCGIMMLFLAVVTVIRNHIGNKEEEED